jgi:hypothetical protein
MKFLAALFLTFMLTKSIQIVNDMKCENISEKGNEEMEVKYNNDFCNKFWLFHIFAFVLGAFWNVKKLLKVGIV